MGGTKLEANIIEAVMWIGTWNAERSQTIEIPTGG
jgi:hypothetical protein